MVTHDATQSPAPAAARELLSEYLDAADVAALTDAQAVQLIQQVADDKRNEKGDAR